MDKMDKFYRQRYAYRRGLRKAERLTKLGAAIDRFLAAASRPLGMCGERRQGKFWRRWNNASKRFARLFWADCSCCLFYRGWAVGFISAAELFVMIAVCLRLAGLL